MLNRRSFVQLTACGALGAAASGLRFPISAKPAGKTINKIGLQLYTVRGEMAKDFDGALRRVAEIGYKEVEFAGYYKRTPQQVKATLDQLGLVAPAAHIPLKEIQTQLDQTIANAKVIGHRIIICPYLEAGDRKSLDQYKQLAATFNRAGAACRKAGLQFGYHNHDFEFEKIGGANDPLPYDLLLAETDKELVKMELDLYWITKANQDPLAYLAKHPGRFITVHVKDMDKTAKRGITEVGRGSIDFKTIFAKAGNAIQHYFVEQDTTPGSPFDSIKISYDHLKQLNF